MRIGERGHVITHLLVGQDVAADLALAPLDELDVSLHAFGGERLGEQVADVRVGVQAGKLDTDISNWLRSHNGPFSP